MIADLRIRAVSNDELGIWIEAFLDDLEIANRSLDTIRFYWWCRTFNAQLNPERLTTLTFDSSCITSRPPATYGTSPMSTWRTGRLNPTCCTSFIARSDRSSTG